MTNVRLFFQRCMPLSRSFATVSFLLWVALMLWPGISLWAQNNTQRQDSIISRFLDKTPETLDDYTYLITMFLDKAPEKSFKLSLEAIEKAKKTGGSPLAKAYKSAGLAANRLRQFDQANVYYDSAMQFFASIPDSAEMAAIYNNIGNLYSNFALYVKAIEYYDHALALFSILGDNRSIGVVNNNIGSLFQKLRSYDQASEHFLIAFGIARQLNDSISMVSILNNLGTIRQSEKRHEEAIQLYRQSLSLSIKTESLYNKGLALLNIGSTFINEKQPDSAFRYLNQALELFQETGNTLADVWYCLGKTHEINGSHRQALNAFLRAYDEVELFPDIELKSDILVKLYESWKKLGNETEAFHALQAYHHLTDSIKTRVEQATAANMTTRFNVAKKMSETAQLKKEKEAQERVIIKEKETNKLNYNLLLLSLLAVVVLLGVLIFIFWANRRSLKVNKLLKQQYNELEQAKNELTLSHSTIAEQEEKLSILINAMPDIITFKDGMGRWLVANSSVLHLFRLSQIDYKGKTDLDLIADSPECEFAFRVCAISDEEAWQQRKAIRSDETIADPMNIPRVFDIIKIPLFFSDGTRKGLLVIGRDITERKQAEIDLESALQKAEEADRLKSAFMANMSHEIRTPLNAVIGFGELLETEHPDPQKTKEFVHHIRTNSTALLHLINEILELSVIESGSIQLQSETFDIRQLFCDLNESFTQLAQQKGKGRIRIKAVLPSAESTIIFSDKNRIRQILVNLFDNALKFTGEGSISFGYEILNSDRHSLRLYISDTGIGIPQSKQHLLFKRFTKIHESSGMIYPGAGLGLSIVQQIVELMDGKIKVNSMAGSGSTFEIEIPLGEPENTSENISGKRDLEHLTGKKVLIVEDVDSNYELLEIILKSLGMHIVRAVEGQQAIEICKHQDDIDIVLMDIQLKGMNGYEATKVIKKIKPHLPIIAQTAYAMANEKDACFTAGCDGYIAKPIKRQLLIPVLAQIIPSARQN